MQQLEGQVASALISMAWFSSPQLYYVRLGSDLTLDINNPGEPKIVCMRNNPQKISVYGAELSLHVTILIKLGNKKGKLKSILNFDEFPTIRSVDCDSRLYVSEARYPEYRWIWNGKTSGRSR